MLTLTGALALEYLRVEGKDTAGLEGREKFIVAFCLKDCVVWIGDKELSAGWIEGFSAGWKLETRLAAVRDQALKGIGLEKFGTAVSGRLFANIPFFDAEWFEVCPLDEALWHLQFQKPEKEVEVL
jgi:hypothetical protein